MLRTSTHPPTHTTAQAKTEVALAPLRTHQPDLVARNVLNEAFADPTPDEYRRWGVAWGSMGGC